MDEFKIHVLAWREFRRAFSWYLARDVRAAERFDELIWHGFAEIRQHPDRWPWEDEFYRYYLLPRYPYRIIYRHQLDRIFVLRWPIANGGPGIGNVGDDVHDPS